MPPREVISPPCEASPLRSLQERRRGCAAQAVQRDHRLLSLPPSLRRPCALGAPLQRIWPGRCEAVAMHHFDLRVVSLPGLPPPHLCAVLLTQGGTPLLCRVLLVRGLALLRLLASLV